MPENFCKIKSRVFLTDGETRHSKSQHRMRAGKVTRIGRETPNLRINLGGQQEHSLGAAILVFV